MFEILLSLIALVLVVCMSTAYRKTRDVLHPALFLGALFLYGVVWDPWLVSDDLAVFFPEPDRVNRVLVLYLLSVAALTIGILPDETFLRRIARRRREPAFDRVRPQLSAFAAVLALVSLACYGYGIVNVGGFTAAFSQAKGGGYAASGYISEAMNLGLVGAAMIAVAHWRRGVTAQAMVLLVFCLLPNLVQGTFGGRRGPLFLALVTGALALLVAKRKRPQLWMLATCLLVACLSVTFVWSQRQHLYLGSANAQVRWQDFIVTLTQDNAVEGNNFVYGAGYVLTSEHAQKFTWGKALAVDLLVRPVPKQLWPTKYEDVGAVWITPEYPGLGPFSPDDWLNAVGWVPLAGSAALSIADVFGEFSWGAVIVFYLIGRGFAWLYSMGRTRGGVWTLLSLEALIPSIYLATQSFSAFYYRYLILAVATVIVWRLVVGAASMTERMAKLPLATAFRVVPRPDPPRRPHSDPTMPGLQDA